jgi:hypothetical protein
MRGSAKSPGTLVTPRLAEVLARALAYPPVLRATVENRRRPLR